MRPSLRILSLVLGISAIPVSTSATDRPRRVTCSLSNPAYSGWCRVTEAVLDDGTPAGVCRSVLACLNDTACTRTYCDATQIRGGWKLEKIEDAPGGQRK